MKKHILKLKLKWFVLLIVSTVVLIWRLIDFAYESADGVFHMTRGGIVLWGSDAEIIEIAMILGNILIIWKSITSLVRLYINLDIDEPVD